ncbi:hypothetical protein KEM55_003716 [Ascosphaera atra]|nr:hypothetical protein KEM55_003716 [Ascosphaera atra]
MSPVEAKRCGRYIYEVDMLNHVNETTALKVSKSYRYRYYYRYTPTEKRRKKKMSTTRPQRPDPETNRFPKGTGPKRKGPDISVYDAHCHPTECMDSVVEIPKLRAKGIAVMATRVEDQELVFNLAEEHGKRLAAGELSEEDKQGKAEGTGKVLPAFGFHPWYSHTVIDDRDNPVNPEEDEYELKKRHYESVLQPKPDFENNEDDKMLLDALRAPYPLSKALAATKERVSKFHGALVGEVGVDKAFRLPEPWDLVKKRAEEGKKPANCDEDVEEDNGNDEDIDKNVTPGAREGRPLSRYRVRLEHQKVVMEAQLRLAGETCRAMSVHEHESGGVPASVHSVGTHGAVLEVLRRLWKGYERPLISKRRMKQTAAKAGVPGPKDEPKEEESQFQGIDQPPRPFPPRICMHSYSGPHEQLGQYLDPKVPTDVYFSFSNVINFEGKDDVQLERIARVIRSVPDDRILAETDLHEAGKEMDEALDSVVNDICEIKKWDLEDGACTLNRNWRRFIYGKE